MNILYCGLKHDYGDPEKGYSFEHINFFQTLQKMQNVKKLDYIPIDEIIKINGKDFLNELIINKVKKEKYDLIFFFLFKDEFYPETLKYLKDTLSIPTIAWMADDHWRFENYSKYYANLYTLYVTTDEKSLLKYKKKKITNVVLSQWACNHYLSGSHVTKKNLKVSFVGMSYGSRRTDIDYLKKDSEINLDCWGSGWPRGKLSNQEMLDVFKNSSVNLNFTKSSNQKNIKTLAKIFLKKEQSKYKFNTKSQIKDNIKIFLQKNTRQIKGRIFEVTGVGGFLLTENCDYLERYFELDKELITFENIEEAKEKIKFYLKNQKIITLISENARKKVLNEHTYEKRFLDLFKKII
jgi:spore maturation protein CgeB